MNSGLLSKNKIMILCKVVDNFGDIGVVYRLARALSDLKPELELTLVVSNLKSFNSMAKKIDFQKEIQSFNYKNSTWKIINWNISSDSASEIFKNQEDFPQIILECFQCGRPDWLENILFSEKFTLPVQIINIDYLTAEEYADDFHLLKSGTRKTSIKKIFFMPGFTENTGSLIINEIKKSNQNIEKSDYNIFFFAYEDDCSSVVKAVCDFQNEIKNANKDFSVKVFLANGKSQEPFETAWKNLGSPFKIEKLSFMQQEEFDYFITQMDFLFVRGEDSLARAALSSLPYIWQAYKQDENYQLVKVTALLERMKSYFTNEEYTILNEAWKNYNDYEVKTDSDAIKKLLLSSFKGLNKNSFENFSKKLHSNGNLSVNLIKFMESL